MMEIVKKALISRKRISSVVLLLTLGLALSAIAGTTLAVIVTRTPTLQNLFISGLDPVGDLAIHKIVEHPFGDSYVVPDNDNTCFHFRVDLGKENANKKFGSDTADENGIITVDVKAGDTVSVIDIPYGTEVTVTEQSGGAGFFVQNGENEKKVNIRRAMVNSVSFTNIYTPAPAPADMTVIGTKTLEGREWQEGDSFTFRLERYTDGAWVGVGDKTITCHYIEQEDPDNPGQSIYAPDPDSLVFDFSALIGSVSFDAAATYSFRVTEVEGNIGGIAYDKAASCFDVLVGDADMDGALEIQSISSASENTSIEGNAVTVNFRNSYAPAGSAEAVIKIQKTLDDTSGQNRVPAGFTFGLYDENSELVTISEATSASGETELRLVYTPSDAGQTFAYTLREINGGETIDGVQYDDQETEIYVSVVDNLDGTVSAFIYDDRDMVSAFGELALAASHEEDISEAESETLEEDILEEESETSEEDILKEESETSEEDVSEEEPEASEEEEWEAITEQEVLYEFLSVSAGNVEMPEIPSDVTSVYTASFTNIYDPENTEVSFEGSKELTGREMKEGEFRFALYETEADFEVSPDAQPLETVSNSADGSFAFGALEFTKIGTYYYAAVEDASDPLGGVDYDNMKYMITVRVSDEGGRLSAVSGITDESGRDSEIVFRNSYQAAGTAVVLSGSKKLHGAALKEGMFAFRLYETDETFAAKREEVRRAVNNADGSFCFDALTYEEAGTYRYIMTEDDSDALDRISYDDTVYGVTVTVTDDGNGRLSAESSVEEIGGGPAEQAVFENTYTPADGDVSVDIAVKKTVKNTGTDTIGPEGFDFVLENTDTNEKAMVQSDEDGQAVFRLLFTDDDAEHTYHYKLYEEAGHRKGVVYSDAVYKLEITVAKDSGGALAAKVSCDGEPVGTFTAEFVNTYEGAEGEKSGGEDGETGGPDVIHTDQHMVEEPRTGDESNLILWIVLIVVSAAVLLGLWCVAKKKKKDDGNGD